MMLCEKCLAKPATVHMQHIINGEKTEAHLCAECAGQQETAVSMDNFFQGFLDAFLSQKAPEAAPANARCDAQCPACGMTYGRFKSVGRLGCARCYETFRGELEGIFKSVQAGSIHHGKLPRKSAAELSLRRRTDALREALASAVEDERFEDAARLRDEIRALGQGSQLPPARQ